MRQYITNEEEVAKLIIPSLSIQCIFNMLIYCIFDISYYSSSCVGDKWYKWTFICFHKVNEWRNLLGVTWSKQLRRRTRTHQWQDSKEQTGIETGSGDFLYIKTRQKCSSRDREVSPQLPNWNSGWLPGEKITMVMGLFRALILSQSRAYELCRTSSKQLVNDQCRNRECVE